MTRITPPADETLIIDADLRKELERHRRRNLAPGMFNLEVTLLIEKQAERDGLTQSRAAELAALAPGARRRAKSKDALEKGSDRQDLRHIHSVLALCGLPYNRQPIEEREYRSKQGLSVR